MDSEQIRKLIEAGLPDAHVRVSGEDGAHFEALVVSDVFEGKRPLARHQLVYSTLGPRMGNEIHALSLRTFTPAEWSRDGGDSV
ncbi:MAG: BolA family protein [Gammaproteobacteria bacterium]|jgi:acid stress-induced BolA-like protein IbaG/YrbA